MLARAANTLRDFLASTTESLRLSSGNLNNASGELNQIASRMTLGINEQFERTDQVATAMHEMSATAQEVARHAAEAAGAADAADNAARQGEMEEARNLLREADGYARQAHHMQTKLIEQDAGEARQPMTLIMVHAQDHLMTTITEIHLIKEVIETRQELNELKKLMNISVI